MSSTYRIPVEMLSFSCRNLATMGGCPLYAVAGYVRRLSFSASLECERERLRAMPGIEVDSREESPMPTEHTGGTPDSEAARLLRELEAAEAYEQHLRQVIVNVREALTTGQTERALSMLNETLNDIDSATDVVVPHKDG